MKCYTHGRRKIFCGLTAIRGLAFILCVSFIIGFVSDDASAQSVQYQAWVDPVNGNDLTGQVDTNFNLSTMNTYKTIQAAIDAVFLAKPNTAHGLVHALPGVYGPDGNNETFPIRMKNRVHVQGAGAKECLIHGRFDDLNVRAFLPTVNYSGGNDGDYYDNLEVLVSYIPGNIMATVHQETMVDGFTFRGGHIHIHTELETPQVARISNCVFDLLDEEQMGMGPLFGILMVAVYDFNKPGYHGLNWKIFNNTFIQGHQFGEGDMFLAIESNVAICSVNNPRPEHGNWDTNLDLRCVSEPSIQNNIIRALPESLSGYPITALLGIDRGDTEYQDTTAGGQIARTNAFNSNWVGSLSVDNPPTYISLINGSIPVPVVDLDVSGGGRDPGFVGEILADNYGEYSPYLVDWRLIPDSPMVDQGRGPDGNNVVMAVNKTTYNENSWVKELSSFDWDGDVHGNPRIVGEHPDIGYDETDAFLIAGCYGDDSKSHGAPWHWTIQTGRDQRCMITPASISSITVYYSAVPGSSIGWTHFPGTYYVGQYLPPYGLLYLNPYVLLNTFAMTVKNATNYVDGTTHVYTHNIYTVSDFANWFFLSEQAVYNSGSGFNISNLQCEYF